MPWKLPPEQAEIVKALGITWRIQHQKIKDDAGVRQDWVCCRITDVNSTQQITEHAILGTTEADETNCAIAAIEMARTAPRPLTPAQMAMKLVEQDAELAKLRAAVPEPTQMTLAEEAEQLRVALVDAELGIPKGKRDTRKWIEKAVGMLQTRAEEVEANAEREENYRAGLDMDDDEGSDDVKTSVISAPQGIGMT